MSATTDRQVEFGLWNTLARDAHQMAVDKGFWDGEDIGLDSPYVSISRRFMLVICELAEAVEADRAGQPAVYFQKSGKPEGVAVELADAIIRCLDMAGHWNVDLDELLPLRSTQVSFDRSGEDFASRIFSLVAVLSREGDDLSLTKCINGCLQLIEALRPPLGAVKIIEKKMAYNKTRPRKHGKSY